MISVLVRLIIAGILWINMPKAYASSCVELVSTFLKTNSSEVSTDNFSKWALAEVKQIELEESVFKSLKEKISTLKKNPSKKDFSSYLLFLDSLRKKEKLKAIADLDKLGELEVNSKILKKHNKIQGIISKEEKRETLKLTEKIKQENPGIPKKVLETRVSKEMIDHMNRYEKLAYGCRSTKWTAERKMAAQSFRKFTIGIGMASSIGAYTYQNYDKEFDGVWFGRLGYELTVGMLTGLVASKIVSNPQNTPVMLSLKKYFFSRSTGLVDMFAYGALFGISDEDARARLNNLVKDPNRNEEIKKLRQFMDEKNIYQEYKTEFFKKLKKYKESGEELNGDGNLVDPSTGKSINWDALTSEDLDDDEIQELLLSAIIGQMYEEQKGDLIATGNVGADRYAFHAAYGAVMMPKDTFIALYIYNTLCMGALNPKAAMIKAIGVFTLNRIIFDQMYYYIRRTSINQ